MHRKSSLGGPSRYALAWSQRHRSLDSTGDQIQDSEGVGSRGSGFEGCRVSEVEGFWGVGFVEFRV